MSWNKSHPQPPKNKHIEEDVYRLHTLCPVNTMFVTEVSPQCRGTSLSLGRQKTSTKPYRLISVYLFYHIYFDLNPDSFII